MVQVQYPEPERPMLHCTHTANRVDGSAGALACVSRSTWRPEATLSATSGSSLEFCGPEWDRRVNRMLLSARSVAS